MANLKITLTRSPIGYCEQQKRTAKALGLTKMHKTVVRPDNEQIRGMVRAIEHLVTVEENKE
jgi:large subunit ribosomal protein L30